MGVTSREVAKAKAEGKSRTAKTNSQRRGRD
jgi:hypothetical protein